MLQCNQVLCLVSLPVAASAALQQAVHLARVGAGEREVELHVVSWADPSPSAFAETVREQIGPLGETTSLVPHVRSGGDNGAEAARRAIQRYTSEIDVDLVVLDLPADPPLAEDRAQALIDDLDCALFMVGEAGAPESVERILVPTDLSDESIYTLRHATELADGCDAEVLLLHVIDRSPYVALTTIDRLSLGNTTLTEHRARRRLQQFLEEGRPSDVPVRTRLSFGEPADRITHVVTEQAVDLLVLASHGGGSDPVLPLGRVADRVLRRVACPTVLVRAGDRSLLPARSDANSAARERGE